MGVVKLNAKELTEKAVKQLEDGGRITDPVLRRLFREGRSLTKKEKEVRDEIFFVVFEICGRAHSTVQRRCGMDKATSRRIIQRRLKEVREGHKGAAKLLEQEEELDAIRFEGRKKLIDLCWDGAYKALHYGIRLIPHMKALDAIKASAILTDKGLLLSGQPTSRVAKTDERMMGDEELEAKAKKYRARVAKLGITAGGDVAPVQTPEGTGSVGDDGEVQDIQAGNAEN